VNTRSQHGFTLVELVLTVGLIALMSSMAAMTFPATLASARLSQAVTQLTGAIREAQIQALRENRAWRVVLDSDGLGFSLEYASSAAAGVQCEDPTGWTQARHEGLPSAIQITQQARPCLSFAPSGRASWSSPEVDTSVTPSNAVWSLARLTDGYQLNPASLPNVITTDPAVTAWRNVNPVITLSFQELRYLTSICLGTFDYPSTTIRYPAHVKVEGAVGVGAPGSWSTIYDSAGPTNPTGGRGKTCISIPINNSYSYLRISLTRSTAVANSWVILDEIDGTNLFIKVQSPFRSKTLVINSVTGRVTVK
jgi:prepilin-type N-terminal cleavage/methylation domain-containing protein